MKIQMVSMAFTQSGMFDKGQVLSTNPKESFNGQAYSQAFLDHLVDAANAAVRLVDYETKIDPEYETEKKPLAVPETKPDTSQSSEALSSQSLPPAPASQKKTRGRPRRTPQ